MKIKCIIIFVITFFFQGCLLGSYNQARENEKKVDRYWLKFSKNLAKKHSMSICGQGGGMNEKVHLLTISFQLKKIVNKEEARLLMLDCIEYLLSNINKTDEIIPLLSHYPFSEKNIEIAIFFLDKENRRIYHPHLNTVCFFSEEIQYLTVDPENINRYKTEEVESYQEALQKVNQISDEN